MNNTEFQRAWKAVGLTKMRVHDLRDTFAQRLRAVGVVEVDRDLLTGHASEGMAQHDATSTLARLIELANKVTETRHRMTILRMVNR